MSISEDYLVRQHFTNSKKDSVSLFMSRIIGAVFDGKERNKK